VKSEERPLIVGGSFSIVFEKPGLRCQGFKVDGYEEEAGRTNYSEVFRSLSLL
jgi:hypothetical protein